MKRLLLVLALCSQLHAQRILAPIMAGAPVASPSTAFVQQSNNLSNDCNNVFTAVIPCPFPASFTNGNTLIVAVSAHTTSNDTVSSITGTGTSGWTKISGTTTASTGCELWKGAIGVGASNSITVTMTGVGLFSYTIKGAEFSSLSTTVDGTAATNTGTSTSPTTAAYSNTHATDLILALMCEQSTGVPSGSPAGYTNLTYVSTTGGAEGLQLSYKTVAATGAQSASWTIANVNWVTVLGALQQ